MSEVKTTRHVEQMYASADMRVFWPVSVGPETSMEQWKPVRLVQRTVTTTVRKSEWKRVPKATP